MGKKEEEVGPLRLTGKPLKTQSDEDNTFTRRASIGQLAQLGSQSIGTSSSETPRPNTAPLTIPASEASSSSDDEEAQTRSHEKKSSDTAIAKHRRAKAKRQRRKRRSSTGSKYSVHSQNRVSSRIVLDEGRLPAQLREYLVHRMHWLHESQAQPERASAAVATVLQLRGEPKYTVPTTEGPFHTFPRPWGFASKYDVLKELPSRRNRRRKRQSGTRSDSASSMIGHIASGNKRDPATVLLLRTSIRALENSHNALQRVSSTMAQLEHWLRIAGEEQAKALSSYEQSKTHTEIIGATRSAEAAIAQLEPLCASAEDEEEFCSNVEQLVVHSAERVGKKKVEGAEQAREKLFGVQCELKDSRMQLHDMWHKARVRIDQMKASLKSFDQMAKSRDFLFDPDYEHVLGVRFDKPGDVMQQPQARTDVGKDGSVEYGNDLKGPAQSNANYKVDAVGNSSAEPIIEKFSDGSPKYESVSSAATNNDVTLSAPSISFDDRNDSRHSFFKAVEDARREQDADPREDDEENGESDVSAQDEEGDHRNEAVAAAAQVEAEESEDICIRWPNLRPRFLGEELTQTFSAGKASKVAYQVIEELDPTLLAEAIASIDVETAARITKQLSSEQQSNTVDFLPHYMVCNLMHRAAIGTAAYSVEHVDEMFKGCDLGREELAGYMAAISSEDAGRLLEKLSATEGAHLLSLLGHTNPTLVYTAAVNCPNQRKPGDMLADLAASSVDEAATTLRALGPKISAPAVSTLLQRKLVVAGNLLESLSPAECANCLRALFESDGPEIAATGLETMLLPVAGEVLQVLAYDDRESFEYDSKCIDASSEGSVNIELRVPTSANESSLKPDDYATTQIVAHLNEGQRAQLFTTMLSIEDDEMSGASTRTRGCRPGIVATLLKGRTLAGILLNMEEWRAIQLLSRMEPFVAAPAIVYMWSDDKEDTTEIVQQLDAKFLARALQYGHSCGLDTFVQLFATLDSSFMSRILDAMVSGSGFAIALDIMTELDADTLADAFDGLLQQLSGLSLARLLENIDRGVLAEAILAFKDMDVMNAKALLEHASPYTCAQALLEASRTDGEVLQWLGQNLRGEHRAQVYTKLLDQDPMIGCALLQRLGSRAVAELFQAFHDASQLCGFVQSLCRINSEFAGAFFAHLSADSLSYLLQQLPLTSLSVVLRLAPEELSANAMHLLPRHRMFEIEQHDSHDLQNVLKSIRAAAVTAAVDHGNMGEAASLLKRMEQEQEALTAVIKLIQREGGNGSLSAVLDEMKRNDLMCDLLMRVAESNERIGWQGLSKLSHHLQVVVIDHFYANNQSKLRALLDHGTSDSSAGQVLHVLAGRQGDVNGITHLVGSSSQLLKSLYAFNSATATSVFATLGESEAAKAIQELDSKQGAEIVTSTIQNHAESGAHSMTQVLRNMRPNMRAPLVTKMLELFQESALQLFRAGTSAERLGILNGMGHNAKSKLIIALADVDPDEAASLLACMQSFEAAELLKLLSLERASELLARMKPPEIAGAVAVMPPKRGDELLNMLEPSQRASARDATGRALGVVAARSPTDAAEAIKQGKLDLLPSIVRHAAEHSPEAAANLMLHFQAADSENILATLVDNGYRELAAAVVAVCPSERAGYWLSTLSSSNQRECGLLLSALDVSAAKHIFHSMREMRQVEGVRCALRMDTVNASRLLFELRGTGLERLLGRLRVDERAAIASNLTPEEAADMAWNMGTEERQALLNAMAPEPSRKAREEVDYRRLLQISAILRKPYLKWLRGISKIARLREYRQRLESLSSTFPVVLKELGTFARPNRVVALIVAALLVLSDGEGFAQHLEQPDYNVPRSDSRLIVFWRSAKRFMKQRSEISLQRRLQSLMEAALQHTPGASLPRLKLPNIARDIVHKQLTLEHVRKALMPAKVLYLWLGALLGYVDLIENRIDVFSLHSAQAEAESLKMNHKTFRSYGSS